jgi:hypothetical protein
MPPLENCFIIFLRLLELLQQAIDFLHLNPGTERDAALARGLEQLRVDCARSGSSS